MDIRCFCSQRDADLVSRLPLRRNGWQKGRFWRLQRGMETLERPRGWGRVSFRGIDVPQYSSDAVDTPICNDPDAISRRAKLRTENTPRRILFSLFRLLHALPGESGSLRGRLRRGSAGVWILSNVVRKIIASLVLVSCFIAFFFILYSELSEEFAIDRKPIAKMFFYIFFEWVNIKLWQLPVDSSVFL